MNQKSVICEIIGETPLLMHSGRLADPMDPISKAIRKISGKRKKVDADFEEMARLEFMGGIYMENDKVIIPGEIFEATVVNGARRTKEGKIAQGGVMCLDNAPLEYSGPKDMDERFKESEYRKTCGVRIKTARIMRTRAIFDDWSAKIKINYNAEIVDPEKLKEWVASAGEIGLMDWRPKFGRFRIGEWSIA